MLLLVIIALINTLVFSILSHSASPMSLDSGYESSVEAILSFKTVELMGGSCVNRQLVMKASSVGTECERFHTYATLSPFFLLGRRAKRSEAARCL